MRMVLLWVMVVLSGCASREERFEFTRVEMGVKTRVVVYALSKERAEGGAQAAFRRIAELDACMSDYREDSELNYLSRQGDTPVSKDLFIVLLAARRVSEASDGAFDVTLGPAVALWRKARAEGKLPYPVPVHETLESMGWRNVELNPRGLKVTLHASSMRLDLGGIAKGFAAEEALKELRRRGISRCLVALAGDICVGEPPPRERGWRIEVAGSGRALILKNACVSTSGDAEQFVEIGGKRYSHIIDPRTGMAMTNHAQATVVGTDGAVVDAAATALCVGGVGMVRAVCEKLGVSAVVREGERVEEVGVIPWAR